MSRNFALVAAVLSLACSSSDAGGGASGTCSFTDPVSGLCWQEPPSEQPLTWQDAATHCQALGLRLPKIHELRSLIRGCATSACIVSDPQCLSNTCRSDPSCVACSDLGGPGTGGCYWDAGLTGTCDWYWSSSGVDEGPYDAWFVYFQSGSVDYGAQGIEKYVRCVR
jgi:hypothetical protein